MQLAISMMKILGLGQLGMARNFLLKPNLCYSAKWTSPRQRYRPYKLSSFLEVVNARLEGIQRVGCILAWSVAPQEQLVVKC